MQSPRRFTVQTAEPASMRVLWFDFEGSGSHITYSEDLKPERISKLKALQPVEARFTELAERKLLTLNTTDLITKRSSWLKKQSMLYRDTPNNLQILNNVKR